MSYPNQHWGQPQVPQPGPTPQTGGVQYGQPGGYSPGYGPPAPGLNLATIDRTKLAAAGVVLCGLIVLIGSLFALYSVTVTPSALSVRNNDAPSGQIGVDIGFYDVLPFAPPIVAEAIPVLMVLAALMVAPSLFGRYRKTSATPAVLAGTATLLSVVLAISGPLPSVDVDGQLAAKLSEKTGGQTMNSLIDSVLSVSPGAGLVIAIIFSFIGWMAAASLAFRGHPQPAPVAAGPYASSPAHPAVPPGASSPAPGGPATPANPARPW